MMEHQTARREKVKLASQQYRSTRLLLFDGECWLCSRLLQFVLKRDKRKRFYFAPLQSDLGRQVKELSPLGPDEESMLYLRMGKCLTKSTAALYLLRDLGGIWSLFFLFIVLPAPLRDSVYDFVARHRHRLVKPPSSCPLPVEGRDRFLT